MFGTLEQPGPVHQIFFLCSLSSPCDILAAFTKYRGQKAARIVVWEDWPHHPVASGCDIHRALTSVIPLKPLHQKTRPFHSVLVLLHLLLLSKPGGGGDGKSRRKPWPFAGRCGSSQLWDSLKLGWEALAGYLAALFSNRLFLPCCSFVVLFYKRNQRADYTSLLGERKGRRDRCPDLL